MRIGLALAGVPGYSETFFRNKVRFLQETEGYQVTLFADKRGREDNWGLCKVIYAHNLSREWGVWAAAYQFLTILLTSPHKVIRLAWLNRLSGFSIRENVQSILRSGHMLSIEVDWLHFGFGTMALGRENVARVMGASMAVSFRGFDIAIYPLKVRHCYDLLWKRTDKVHVISDDLARLVLRQGYPSSKPLVKITPAIDTTRFTWERSDESPVQPLRIATVARLHWKKGLEYTLEALALLRQKGIAFHYTIAGEGEERERLVFAVHQLGLQEQVTFAGKLDQQQVVQLLQQSNIYVQYSIQEGFCNAVLEAQAMELICVVSDAEGLSENVLDGITGWVVPKRSPERLADALIKVMEMSQEERQRMAGQAVSRVREHFYLVRQREAFLEFYR